MLIASLLTFVIDTMNAAEWHFEFHFTFNEKNLQLFITRLLSTTTHYNTIIIILSDTVTGGTRSLQNSQLTFATG
jgi:hypothetical protein